MKKRLLSLVLCLVMVFSLLPAFNLDALAVLGSDVAADGTYTGEWAGPTNEYTGRSGISSATYCAVIQATVTVSGGKITNVTFSQDVHHWPDKAILNAGNNAAINATVNGINNAWNAYSGNVIGKSATVGTIDAAFTGNKDNTQSSIYETVRSAIFNAEKVTAATPAPTVAPTATPTPDVDPDLTPAPDPTPEIIDGDDGSQIVNPIPAKDETGNLNLSKALNENESGGYDITMESYATANVDSQKVTEKVPTDFVLVVDQSGSMDEQDMMSNKNYSPVSGSVNLETVAGGEYYYKVNDDYYRVYAKKGYLYEHYDVNTLWTKNIIDYAGAGLNWFQSDREEEFNTSNQFFYQTDDGVFRSIHLHIQGVVGTYYVRLYYIGADGQQHHFHRTEYPYYKNVFGGSNSYFKPGDSVAIVNYGTVNSVLKAVYSADTGYTFSEVVGLNTGMYINYPMFKKHVGYTELAYRDINGVEHTVLTNNSVATTQYANSSGQAITGATTSTRMEYRGLYTASNSGKVTRLRALNSALTAFADAVANEKDVNGVVDNRIAIVGFSSDGYNNTEILTNTTEGFTISSGTNYAGWGGYTSYNNSSHYSLDDSWHNGIQKSDADANPSYYANALVDATNGTVGTVNPAVTNAINGVTAHGGTQPADGMEMAAEIISRRNDTTYTKISGEVVDRNLIVIFFTDGQPGNNNRADQYAEADKVVHASKALKDLGASVFSIGVFGESDGNPLTYYPPDGKHRTSSEAPNLEFEDGWIKTLTPDETDGYYYYLKRQWRPQNNAYYGATASDTIYDYMSVTSSNYPDAQYFIGSEWLNNQLPPETTYLQAINAVRYSATSENLYYRMASNQDTLISAFEEAVTSIVDIQSEVQTVTLGDTSSLRDAVNLDAFDISGATYYAYAVPVHYDHGSVVEDEGGTPDLVAASAPVPANGKIEVSGFDYSDNYVSYLHQHGKKLVVTISGIQIKKLNETVESNDGKAGIYGENASTPTVAVDSPTVYVPGLAKTIVIDYNYPLQLTTTLANRAKASINGVKGAIASVNTFKANSGTYTVEGGSTLNYQLFTGDVNPEVTGSGTATGAVDLGKYQGVDKALFFTGSGWQSVTTLPATTVYYSDALTTPQTALNGDGSNGSAVSNAETYDTAEYGKQISYTFTGTGIDVYSKTTPGSNYIIGMLSGVTDPSYKANATYKNASNEDRVNVPSIFFHDLPYGTYTLKLYASKGANFLLDGIRVYNPAGTADEASQAIYAAEDLKEQKAHFTNMRELLSAGANMGEGIGFFSDTDVTGDTEKTVTIVFNNPDGTEKSREEYTYRAHSLTAYNIEGPKDEIYLEPGNAIAFTITNMPAESLKFMMGIHISAVRSGSGSLTIGGKAVTSVDQYFDVTPGNDNTIRVANPAGSGVLLSVTNLKVSGGSKEYKVQASGAMPLAVVEDDAAAAEAVGVLNVAVTEETVEVASKLNALRYAADNNGVIVEDSGEIIDPDEPNTPENPNLIDLIRQIISNFVSNLFKSVARLFGN